MKAFMIATMIFLSSAFSFATWDLEQRKIDFLLNSIEQLNATFIRSGVEYTGSQAARHLRMKLRQAQNSNNNSYDNNYTEVTAEAFIEQVASKSYFTGQPYYIRLQDGQMVPARDWLYQQLGHFQSR